MDHAREGSPENDDAGPSGEYNNQEYSTDTQGIGEYCSDADSEEEGVPTGGDEENIEAFVGGLAADITACLSAWRSVALADSRGGLDTEAIALAERKEDYVLRRKTLSGKVREFTKSHLNADTEVDVLALKVECKNIVNLFKSEYDHVAGMMKSSEAAFLSMYLLLRDAPDPYPVMEQVVQMQLAYQHELEETKHALAQARETSTSPREQPVMGGSELADFKAKLKEGMDEENRAHRAQLEEELRRREVSLRQHYESHDHDVQQSFQSLMATKDAEMARLSTTAEEAAQRLNEYIERDLMLSAQVERQGLLEDKVGALTSELHDKGAYVVELEEKASSVQSKLQSQERALADAAREHEAHVEEMLRRVQLQQSDIERMRSDLQSRPPVDITAFAVKLGMPLFWLDGDGGDEKTEGVASDVTWDRLEEHVLLAVRNATTEASECRSREAEAQQSVREATRKIGELTEKLNKREQSVASLESDLRAAEDALRACSGGQGGNNSSRKISMPLGDLQELGGDIESNSNNDVGASLIQAVQGQRDRLGRLAQEHEKDAILLRASLQRSREEVKELQADNVELFKRLRIARAAAATPTGGGGAPAPAQPSMGVDSRGNVIKSRSSRKKSALTWNYGDSSPAGADDGAQSTPASFGILSAKGNGKYSEASADVDALEGKYMQLYEAQLDPFKIEEVDRQIVMSRLNVLDWGLANISRILLKDQWTRYALLLYIFLVHVFASGYVIQVLNPEIMSEIDGTGTAAYSVADGVAAGHAEALNLLQ